MAKIIGCLATSHIPAIGGAIAKGSSRTRTGSRFSMAFRRPGHG